MARYFFDIHDGDSFTPDDVGIECATLEDMREAAIVALPDVARDVLPDGDHRDIWVKVRDVEGKALLKASLTLNVRWSAGPSG